MRITTFILIFSLFEINSIPTLDSVKFFAVCRPETEERYVEITRKTNFSSTSVDSQIKEILTECQTCFKKIITQFNFEENFSFFYHLIISIIAFQNGQIRYANFALYNFFHCMQGYNTGESLDLLSLKEEIKNDVFKLFNQLMSLNNFIRKTISKGIYFANSHNELDAKIESEREEVLKLYVENPSKFDFTSFSILLDIYYAKFEDANNNTSCDNIQFIIDLIYKSQEEEAKLNQILALMFLRSDRITVGVKKKIQELRRRV